ncbi:MAG: hypothetical protein J6K45_04865 [Clostridia bacterium]|nr:hypothetical protein [Clostridia bacterium]
MTDNKIIQVAESFKLPVGNQRIYENEVEDYNYIIIRKGTLKKNNCGSYVRTIEIIYVYDGEQTIKDSEIIKAFEDINLRFIQMDPDDIKVGDTNKWVDMNTYIFERPERIQ